MTTRSATGGASQGDEDNDAWQVYLNHAQRAFVAYQALRNPTLGPMAWSAARAPQSPVILLPTLSEARSGAERPDLYTTWSWGEQVKVFVMDTRTNRDESQGRLMSEDQWRALEAWLASADPATPTLFVLGSALPITEELNGRAIGTVFSNAEGADDRRDRWSSAKNVESWQRIASMLTRHFALQPKHRLLVLSGDVHRSGVHYLKIRQGDTTRIIGHEVNASGLSNESSFAPPGSVSPQEQEDILEEDDTLLSIPRALVRNSPSFAEIFVEKADEPDAFGFDLRVGASFYVSSDPSGAALVNLAPTRSGAPRPVAPRPMSTPTRSRVAPRARCETTRRCMCRCITASVSRWSGAWVRAMSASSRILSTPTPFPASRLWRAMRPRPTGRPSSIAPSLAPATCQAPANRSPTVFNPTSLEERASQRAAQR